MPYMQQTSMALEVLALRNSRPAIAACLTFPLLSFNKHIPPALCLLYKLLQHLHVWYSV